ncbi:MAG: ABC transporter ATP-binding protein [Chloroflexi bacterium]|nr:ABC transporter ATP-binding protein [Chloroflexota bacterium]MDA1272090.1 ABC transporter ATP-binding protein [Chloroflexota bacterium]
MSSSQPVIDVKGVSKWYGNVVAVNDVTLQVHPGITGLLGPNGAGKSTILHLITGKAQCSEGEVTVLGQPVRGNPALYRDVGVMAEHESVYGFYTGREFVQFAAKLQGLKPSAGPVDRAIGLVGLADAQHRKLSTYSRGMRQRMRLAAALVHDPQVLILDEPLNGTDPRQRLEFHAAMVRLAEEGRTVLISSHILEEVETLASTILLMVSGKLAAAGDFRAIREKLDEQAYKVRVVTDSPRRIASALAGTDDVDSVSIDGEGELTVLSRNVTALQRSIPRLAQEHGIRLKRVEPLDDSLESIFSYVVDR